jgi:hypothetical protein
MPPPGWYFARPLFYAAPYFLWLKSVDVGLQQIFPRRCGEIHPETRGAVTTPEIGKSHLVSPA